MDYLVWLLVVWRFETPTLAVGMKVQRGTAAVLYQFTTLLDITLQLTEHGYMLFSVGNCVGDSSPIRRPAQIDRDSRCYPQS